MKGILLSTATAWLARIIAIALNLIGLPLALHYLGPSRFGLLLVIASIGSWIGFANIGMGRVVSRIVARQRHSGSNFVTQSVSTATALSAMINLLLIAGGTALFFLVMSVAPINALIADNYREFVVSIISIFVAMGLWFFLSVFEGVDAGNHQLHRLYAFQLGSYLLSLAVLFLVFPSHPSIWFAAYLLNFSFMLGCVFHAYDVVRRNRAMFTRSFRWRPSVVKLLLLSSLDFTIINLCTGVIFQLPTGLFGFIWGPETVLNFGIFIRLIQSYAAVVIAFTFPLSNLVTTKLKLRDLDAAIRVARLSGFLLLGGATFGAAVFMVFGKAILSLWLRSTINPDVLFMINASALIVVVAAHLYLVALLVGAGSIKAVARIHLGEATASVLLSSVLFKELQEGGILLAMNVVLIAGCILMLRLLRQHPALNQLLRLRRTSVPQFG